MNDAADSGAAPAAERDLVRRAVKGDAAAFGRLVQLHQKAVFNVAFRFLGRRPDAEDAAQDTFIRAYRALDRFDTTRPLAPWLKRIAVNVCLNRLEAQRIRPETLATDMGRPDDAPFDRLPGRRPTPEQAALATEQAAEIRQALAQLPPRYRAVIELRHFQGLSYAEMSATLERPLSSVKSDLFRARRQLAALLSGLAPGAPES